MFDYAIIGAGMAGASLAAELVRHEPALKIALLEAEERPGYHATGRSAAFWEQCYGGPQIVPLTLASGPYLRHGGYLKQRGGLYIGKKEDGAAFDRFEARFRHSGASFERIGRTRLTDFVPGLREEWCEAVWQPDCADIDVAKLHEDYLAAAKKGGVDLRNRFRVEAIENTADGWKLKDSRGSEIVASTIVNAAGAWADTVATLAGVAPLGIAPLRRTVVQVRTDPAPPADLPLVLDINGSFYFKPESGRLWVSPHDEIPAEAGDAAPEEIDVATGVERVLNVVKWKLQGVERRWAGLRSFAPDRLPIYGPDPTRATFVWFAGQGGYGIQTAPAAARLTAQLLLGFPPDDMTKSLEPELYDPARFL